MKKKRAQLQLTISILVSNHIDTIGLCMESIKPILENIPSELIVVDTVGKEKSDGSLAVAEKYANLVVPFEWCDDFSAARNAGLKHARGEWFMFLDDDEWFEDASAIISFFKTGEYRNYGIGYFNIRNYTNLQGTAYTEGTIGRLQCLRNGARFMRPIHERLEPTYGEVRYLDCFVHHYGYCYKNQKESREKGQRNIRLLQNELKKDPENFENRLYLAREYSANKEYKKAEEEFRCIVYELPHNKAKFTLHYNWVRYIYLYYLVLRKNFEDALKEGESLLSDFPFNDLTAGRICVVLSEATEAEEDWEKTLQYCEKYIDKYDALDEHKNTDKAQEIFSMSIKELKLNGNEMVRRGILSGLKLEQATNITRILQWFWDKDSDKNAVTLSIEQYKEQSEDYDSVLTQCLSEINSEHNYILLNKLLATDTKSVEEAQQAFNAYFEKNEFSTANRAAILKIVSKQQLHIEALTSRINVSQWEDWLKDAYADFSLLELEAFREKTKQALSHENEIKYQSFLRVLEKYILLNKAKEEKELSWEDVSKYCLIGLENYRSIYNEILFQEENQPNLPEDAQFLISIEKCLEFKESENTLYCIRTLKEGLIKCPSMKEVVECILKLIQIMMDKERKAEFDDLKYKLIQEMTRFIDNGQRAEANMILTNLKRLLPNDEALLALEERIRQM